MKNRTLAAFTVFIFALTLSGCDPDSGSGTGSGSPVLKNSVVEREGRLVFLDERGSASDFFNNMGLQVRTGGGLGVVVLGDTALVPQCDPGSMVSVYRGPRTGFRISLVNENELSIVEGGAVVKSFKSTACNCFRVFENPDNTEGSELVEVRASSECANSAF